MVIHCLKHPPDWILQPFGHQPKKNFHPKCNSWKFRVIPLGYPWIPGLPRNFTLNGWFPFRFHPPNLDRWVPQQRPLLRPLFQVAWPREVKSQKEAFTRCCCFVNDHMKFEIRRSKIWVLTKSGKSRSLKVWKELCTSFEVTKKRLCHYVFSFGERS